MPGGTRTDILRHLQKLVDDREARDLTDGELLGRFVERRDEVAFAILVQRHGPMVLGSCMRILGDAHRAEDVFQATFLILVRRAAVIRKRQSLGSWLYGVVLRVAGREKLRAARQNHRDRQVDAPTAVAFDDGSRHELRRVLDEELGRLSEKYRAPVILCYLEGKTQEQAARELGCPRSTLSSRISLAQGVLRKRLARRGVALSGAAIFAAVTERSAMAAVPARLVLSTVRAATGAETGIPAPAVALAEAANRSVLASNGRLVGLLLLGMAFAVAGVAMFEQTPRPAAGRDDLRAAQSTETAMDHNGDPLPAGAVVRLGTDRLRHGSSRGLLEYSRDGKTLISAALDGVVHVCDVKTGRELRHFSTLPLQDGALSPDHKLVAVADLGNEVGIWDFTSGKRRTRIKQPHAGRQPSVAFSADGKILALADLQRSEVVIFDTSSGQPIRTVKPEANVQGLARVAFAPDDSVLLVKSRDGTTHFCDPTSGKEIRSFAKTSVVFSPAYGFSPDAKTFARGEGAVVVLHDVADGKEIARLTGRDVRLAGQGLDPAVEAVVFSPDGKTLAAGGNGLVQLWDLAGRKVVREFNAFQRRGGYLMRFSPDGKTFATAGDQEPIRLWDIAAGEEHLRFEGHSGGVSTIAFFPDGKMLVTLSGDRTLRLWESSTGKPAGTVPAAEKCLAFARDHKSVFVGDREGVIHVLNAANGEERNRFTVPEKWQEKRESRSVEALTLAPDGKSLVVTIRCRSFDGPGNAARTFTLNPVTGEGITRAAALPENTRWFLSSDGRLQIGNTRPGKCDVHEARTGKLLFSLDTNSEVVYYLAFSPDGRKVAGGCFDSPGQQPTIAVWEVASGKEIRRFKPAVQPPWYPPFAFSPDGRILAVGGDGDSGIVLWDLSTAKEIVRYRGFASTVTSLAFSDDGRRLAGGQGNGAALVWDIDAAVHRESAAHESLTPRQLEQAWSDLGDAAAATGQAAVFQLAERPEQAIALLKHHLHPAAEVDAKLVLQFIARLASDSFSEREVATRQLEQLDQQADSLLRQALADAKSAETRRRLETALARPKLAHSSDTLRRLRAIQLLEQIASAEARDLLTVLADGAPTARETLEAQVALARLAGKSTP
jgi:RNA polymerase sigma factor (sigma-70 family)